MVNVSIEEQKRNQFILRNVTTLQKQFANLLDTRPSLRCTTLKVTSPVGCLQPAAAHDAMSAGRDRHGDTVELLPLKSALVNNNREDEAYYAPPAVPSTSNLYDYTLLSKRTPASKR